VICRSYPCWSFSLAYLASGSATLIAMVVVGLLWLSLAAP